MSGKAGFIKKEDHDNAGKSRLPNSWFMEPQHKRFVKRYVSDTPTSYEEGIAAGAAGMVVPVSKKTGGIPDDANPYGMIVVGHVFGESEQPEGHVDVSVLEKNIEMRSRRSTAASTELA